MAMPRSSEDAKAHFRAIVPADPRVQVRPMFGNLAAFANGNMFMGLFGQAVFVRLAEAERAELLREPGARGFEPMAGRPMREYVVLPEAWHQDPALMQPWIGRSLEWAAGLPGKAPTRARASKKARAK